MIKFYSVIATQIENSKLQEQISDLKFVLEQNSVLIKQLKAENDSKSLFIVNLQSGETKEKSSPNYFSNKDI